MVKVQHGWQSNTLDEVESLASKHGSPASSSAATFASRQHVFASPRAEMAAKMRRQWSGSSDEKTAARDAAKQNSPKHLNGIIKTSTSPTTYGYVPVSQAEESFVRHPPAGTPHSIQGTSGSQKPYLAPPADIMPNPRRRPGPVTTHLQPEGAPTVIPATPPPLLSATKRRTPSQHRALQEQDAIETLMFMSSPGNSGYRSNTADPSSTLTSPMRSQFSINERRVNFAHGIVDNSEINRIRGQPKSRLSNQVADIDRLLDEMEDEGSSDDESQAMGPPRVAAVART